MLLPHCSRRQVFHRSVPAIPKPLPQTSPEVTAHFPPARHDNTRRLSPEWKRRLASAPTNPHQLLCPRCKIPEIPLPSAQPHPFAFPFIPKTSVSSASSVRDLPAISSRNSRNSSSSALQSTPPSFSRSSVPSVCSVGDLPVIPSRNSRNSLATSSAQRMSAQFCVSSVPSVCSVRDPPLQLQLRRDSRNFASKSIPAPSHSRLRIPFPKPPCPPLPQCETSPATSSRNSRNSSDPSLPSTALPLLSALRALRERPPYSRNPRGPGTLFDILVSRNPAGFHPRAGPL